MRVNKRCGCEQHNRREVAHRIMLRSDMLSQGTEKARKGSKDYKVGSVNNKPPLRHSP